MRSYPASILANFRGEVPEAPTISSVSDNGDQSSITVSVSGSNTIQLYYRTRNTIEWIEGESRSGDGDIVQGDLTGGSWYELYATSIDGEMESAPSSIKKIKVLGSDDSTIETAIFSMLADDSEIGSMAGDRIYPNKIPQDSELPAITYQEISGLRQHVMAGPVGLVKSRYQVNCWAESYSECKTLSEAVRKEMDGYDGTVNGVEIEVIMLASEIDIPEISEDKEIISVYGKGLDFVVWYKEATS